MQAYEYKHVVSFDETNLVGNVYYSNHVRWQGLCREMFLYEHAPETLTALKHGFVLVTTRVSCEYLAELFALEQLIIRMRLGAPKQNRIPMLFEYYRSTGDGEELVARGEQEVACMQRDGDKLHAVPIPANLQAALRPYAAS